MIHVDIQPLCTTITLIIYTMVIFITHTVIMSMNILWILMTPIPTFVHPIMYAAAMMTITCTVLVVVMKPFHTGTTLTTLSMVNFITHMMATVTIMVL